MLIFIADDVKVDFYSDEANNDFIAAGQILIFIADDANTDFYCS